MQMDVVCGGHSWPPLRIGTDLVEIASIEASIRAFGERYLSRVFTEREVTYCQRSTTEMGSRLAARFAAKEATLKVLRPDNHWPAWKHIEIVRHEGGWCEIALFGPARELARSQGVTILSCSLSHEGAYANAVVLGTASVRSNDSPDNVGVMAQ